MELIYRILICSLPFLASFAAYYWLIKKLIGLNKRGYQIAGGVVLAVGLAFTLWQAVRTFSDLSDNSFNFMVIIVNVFVMAFTSIAIAAASEEGKS